MLTIKTINIFSIMVLVVLFAAIFANSMTKPPARDEQLYCSAGVLLSQGKMIYKDFSYPAQMPYHPLIYAGIFKLFNTNYYLLTARIFSAICDICVAIIIAVIYRRLFKDFRTTGVFLSVAAVVLYVFNPSVDYANGYAWNHDPVIFCVVLAFFIFQSTDFKDNSRYLRIAAIGALLTLATWMRITTGLAQLVFFAMLFFEPVKSTKQRFKNVSCFLSACAAFSIWPVWTMLSAPRAFYLNFFRVSALNSQWLHQSGSAYNKVPLAIYSLTAPGYFILIALSVYLYVTFFLKRRGLKIPAVQNPLPAILLAAAFFTIAFVTPLMWQQYFAMPVPFIIISLAYPLLYLRKYDFNRHFRIACIVIIICMAVAVDKEPVVFQRIAKLFKPHQWTALQFHRISEDIAKRTKEPKLMLTLGPLLALEGGGQIYTELSAGSFVYRVAELLTEHELEILGTTSPKTLDKLVGKQTPSAVILGVEPRFLEEALYEVGVREDWQSYTYENGLTVYYNE